VASSRAARRMETRPAPRAGSGELLRQLDSLARVTDDLVRIPGLGWRVGIDPIIGLIPGLGDVTATALALAILLGAAYVGVPKVTLLRMGLNTALDLVIGAIPFVGDAFDVWFRANQRNMLLLHQRAPSAAQVARRATPGDWAFVVGVITAILALLMGVLVVLGWLLSLLATQLARLIVG
jgi:hypothetical protein